MTLWANGRSRLVCLGRFISYFVRVDPNGLNEKFQMVAYGAVVERNELTWLSAYSANSLKRDSYFLQPLFQKIHAYEPI